MPIIREFGDAECIYKSLGKDTSAPYYHRGDVSTLEFVEQQELRHTLASAVEYICRAGHKPGCSELSDLEGALWHIHYRIDQLREPHD